MGLAIELPDEYEQNVKAGETLFTYQLADEIKVGSTITLISGTTKRKIRVTNKRWVPETSMNAKLREKILTIAPPREKGFSGAFQIAFEYVDSSEQKPRQNYAADVDRVADNIKDI